MAGKSAHGTGTIRQRPDGRWEARYTAGRHPGTGKQIQRSVYGATQAEVSKRIREVLSGIDNGTHVEPSRMTVKAWLGIWAADYLGSLKQGTQADYRRHIKNHLAPCLGEVKLQKIKPHQIQGFYNSLIQAGLSAKTVKNIHGVLHSAMEQAVKLGYIQSNPTAACTLPRYKKPDIKILDADTVGAFLTAIQGHPFEALFFVDLFTGMRQGEILGLTWDCVDFQSGLITVNKQLTWERKAGGKHYLDATKTDNTRTIKAAPVVLEKLKGQKLHQTEKRLMAGAGWQNKDNLVFTNDTGRYLLHDNVYKHFKKIAASIGEPSLRFHDLRHSYAVASLRAGDDVKVLQSNLGHSTISTTLDVYGHVTDTMKEESAKRMEEYIQSITGGKA